MPWPKIQMWCLVICLRTDGSKLHHEVKYDDQTASEYSGYNIRHQAMTFEGRDLNSELPQVHIPLLEQSDTAKCSNSLRTSTAWLLPANRCWKMTARLSTVPPCICCIDTAACVLSTSKSRGFADHLHSIVTVLFTLELSVCNAARQREPNALPGHNHSSFGASTVASKSVCVSKSSHEGLSAAPVSPRG